MSKSDVYFIISQVFICHAMDDKRYVIGLGLLYMIFGFIVKLGGA